MNGLGDALALMQRASRSHRGVRVVFRLTRHIERRAAAWEAAARTAGGTLVPTAGGRRRLPAETEELVRIWHRPPDRIREERSGVPGCERTTARVGERWWSLDERYGAITGASEGAAGFGVAEELRIMLDPWPVVGELVFDDPRPGERANRTVLGLRARPRTRTPVAPGTRLDQLGTGADEYLLEIDAERGLLLRLEARLGEAPFLVNEVTDVEFDLSLPDSTFRLEPPEGERFRELDESHAILGLPIGEAAGLAPFGVFVPDRVPEGWRLQISYSEAAEWGGSPATVALYYSSADATIDLTIVETPAAQAEPALAARGDAERLERPGLVAWVAERRDPVFAEVSTIREGTEVALSSQTLPSEELISLAQRLQPVPPSGPGDRVARIESRPSRHSNESEGLETDGTA